MRPNIAIAIADLISGWRKRKYHEEEAEIEVAGVELSSGPAPAGMSVKKLGHVEEPDPWPPDSARRLIKLQALRLGANFILYYREEPMEEGCICCYGEAALVTGSVSE